MSHSEKSPSAFQSPARRAIPSARSSSNAGTAKNDMPGALSEYVRPWYTARSNCVGLTWIEP